MSCLPKPLLRGHVSRLATKMILGALAFGAMNSSLFYFFVAKPKQDAYKEFYKTYDPDAHYDELVKYNLIYSPKESDD